MTSKTITAARPKPQPTQGEVEQFVAKGRGADNRPTAPQAAPKGPTKKLTLEIPDTLHTRFKIACAATQRKMVQELTALIESRTAELEKDVGLKT